MTSNTDRLQFTVRALSILASFQIMMQFISPALWILTTPQSIVAKVAQGAYSAQVIGFSWLIASIFVIPYVIMQIFDHHHEHRRIIIKVCNIGNIAGALIWFFMAFMARNLEYGYVVFNFLLNGMGSLVMATLLANGLNNDQIEAALFTRRFQT